MPRNQAAIAAGVSRLRPILMTSLATIAGTLPLAFGIGAGAEVRSPMGIAIIGGFTTSTLLTLVVVPVLFTYVDSLQYWFTKLGRGGSDKQHGTRKGDGEPEVHPETTTNGKKSEIPVPK